MPPRKAPAKAATKPKAKPKQQPSKKVTVAAPKIKAPPAAPKKRKAELLDGDEPPTPPWDKNIRSNYARSKSRYRLSMSNSDNCMPIEELDAMAATLTSTSQNTWGTSFSGPIEGSHRPAKRVRRPEGFLRGYTGNFHQAEQAFMAMMGDMAEWAAKRKGAGVNCPSKSRLLGLSLEIRERIYEYLLIYPKPILLKDDWTTPERNPYISHDLVFVCKQFAREGTEFLFKNNTFVSLLRIPMYQNLRYEKPSPILDSALRLYKNLVLDCESGCWTVEWYRRATAGMQKLANADPSLESLTLRFCPLLSGPASMGLSRESCVTPYANFLCYESDFMKAVRAIAPKKLVVVVKKAGRVKISVDIDMRDLRLYREHEVETEMTEESSRVARARFEVVSFKLRGLKDLYEEIVEDHTSVLKEGKCKLLDDGTSMIESYGILGLLNCNKSRSFRSGTETESLNSHSRTYRSQSQSSSSESQTTIPEAEDCPTPGAETCGGNDSPWVFGFAGSIEEQMGLLSHRE